MPGPVHDTFVLEHDYPKPVAAVFSAFSDPDRKRRWYAEGGAHEVVSYDLDFRLGGHEVLVGRMKPGTPIAGAVLTWSQTVLDVAAGERIVFSQTLDWNDRRISCALVTVEFRSRAGGCSIVLTHQCVYLEGADGPDMRRMGWQALLAAIGGALGE